MTSIQIYDGNNTIGGNKVYLEEKDQGVFIDFGMNFKTYGEYYQEYIFPRGNRGIYDLFHLNLIPKLNIYRKDIIPSDIDVSSFPKLNVKAILVSHAHMDHFGNIGLLDTSFPIMASPLTLVLLKGILDTTRPKLGSDAIYYLNKISMKDNRLLKPEKKALNNRNIICTEKFSKSLQEFLEMSPKEKKDLIGGMLINLESFASNFQIKPFEVDHSIYGATAYILVGDSTIAYTGDFRLHGRKGTKTEEFIKAAKNVSVLITEGTRAGKEDSHESEALVYENCLKASEGSKGLIISDFSARNFERLDSFNKIAKKIGRTLVITAKDAYMLDALKKADGIDRLKETLVYKELKTSSHFWELILGNDAKINYIDPVDISKDPDNFIICFSLYDIKNLLDFKIKGGTYIYSSSEAFEEESEYDHLRLNSWLKHFDFKIIGFKIVKEGTRLKPEFTKGYHASGHVSKNDLIKMIDTIDPDIIIPIHTENPEWFKENFEKAVLLNNDKKYTI